MNTLTVRMYNVGFGDAILISIPDNYQGQETIRHILIDLGNLVGCDPGIFGLIAKDIMKRTGGKPLDLYIMTHEHMDHVRGLKHAAGIGCPIPINYVWMTVSADPKYGLRFPNTKRTMDSFRQATDRLRVIAKRRGLMKLSGVEAFFLNNDYRTTSKCVDYIRESAQIKASYIHRRFPLRAGRDHPFREAKLKVLAPENDSSVYYGRMRPLTECKSEEKKSPSDLEKLVAPKGVDAVAFDNLMTHLAGGLGDRMLAIDKAKNDTSIVLQLQWRGLRLLFPGDAEHKSWRIMYQRELLKKPFHFLKVSHHGSVTGMPDKEIFDRLLPATRSNDCCRYAAVSTQPGHWQRVPNEEVLKRVKSSVTKFFDTRDAKPGQSILVSFPSPEDFLGGGE